MKHDSDKPCTHAAESKKDELELNGGNIPPTALKAKEPPAAAPVTASKAPPTAAVSFPHSF